MLKGIEELRKEIRLVDKELVTVLNKRFKIVKKMITIKDKKKIKIEDLKREEEILSKINNKCVKEIYGVMFKHAKNHTL